MANRNGCSKADGNVTNLWRGYHQLHMAEASNNWYSPICEPSSPASQILKNSWVLEGEEALFLQIYNCMNVWILGASENPVIVSHCHRIKSPFLDDFQGFL